MKVNVLNRFLQIDISHRFVISRISIIFWVIVCFFFPVSLSVYAVYILLLLLLPPIHSTYRLLLEMTLQSVGTATHQLAKKRKVSVSLTGFLGSEN